MSVTTTARPPSELTDQRVVIPGIDWKQYVTINDALVDRRNPRMIYVKGRLTFLVTSRRHDWYAELLGQLVVAVASGCGIPWEPAGQATYRLRERDAGIEGDRVYYLGPSAEVMKGPVNIDLSTQPPPDLAIEVEVSHPADEAMAAWGRIGVREVWRFDANTRRVTFWLRRDDGSYAESEQSGGLPMLRPEDISEQMRLAESLGSPDWYAQLDGWVRDTLLPRLGREA